MPKNIDKKQKRKKKKQKKNGTKFDRTIDS